MAQQAEQMGALKYIILTFSEALSEPELLLFSEGFVLHKPVFISQWRLLIDGFIFDFLMVVHENKTDEVNTTKL